MLCSMDEVLEKLEMRRVTENFGVLLDKTKNKLKEMPFAGQLDNDVPDYLTKRIRELEKVSQIGGFTLTFSKKFKNEDPRWLMRYVQEKINNSRVWKGKEYILLPEFTKNGDLHFHGVLWNCYQVELLQLTRWWSRSFGFTKPEIEIANYDNWIRYIFKDYGKTGLWTIYNFKKEIKIIKIT